MKKVLCLSVLILFIILTPLTAFCEQNNPGEMKAEITTKVVETKTMGATEKTLVIRIVDTENGVVCYGAKQHLKGDPYNMDCISIK